MHHLVFMCVIQRAGDPRDNLADLLDRQHHTGIEHFAQGFAFQIFHGDIGNVVGFTHIVDRDDIGVAQTARRLGLTVKPFLELGTFLI